MISLQAWLVEMLAAHPFAAPAIFIVMRIASVVISVIPGAAIDIPGIAFFGWLRALIYAEIGVMIGATICFLISRHFKDTLLRRFVSLEKLQAWEGKLSEREAFWSWVGLRLTTNPAFDYLSYAAGLTKCTLRVFVLSTLVGSLPNMIVFFALGGVLSVTSFTFAVVLAGLLLLAFMAYRVMRRTKANT